MQSPAPTPLSQFTTEQVELAVDECAKAIFHTGNKTKEEFLRMSDEELTELMIQQSITEVHVMLGRYYMHMTREPVKIRLDQPLPRGMRRLSDLLKLAV